MRGVWRVLVTLALAASSVGYLLAEKRVTLADEGRTRTVATFAPTVGAALERMGVKLGPGDKSFPSTEAALDVDDKIEVRRAKDVIVVLNGARSVERVTGRTVQEVLDELRVDETGARLYPSAGAKVSDGDEIIVSRPVNVTVEHDGVSQPVVTNVMTAGALLRQLGIVLSPHDRIEPSIITSPTEGAVFKVVRVTEVTERTTSAIPFKKVIERTDTLELGVRRLKSAGADGVRAKSYRVVYEDGRIKSRQLLGTEVVKAPKDEVMLVGTRRPVLPSVTGSETGIASWYETPETRCRSKYGDMTAAHKTLPFGTIVKVTSLSNGRTVTVRICDRGPYVEGRIIDLNRAAFAELASPSTGLVRVKIEW